jgi:tetratricopeptide (TPR) repeat protein
MSGDVTPASQDDLRLRRALLRAGRADAMVQDRIDCAEIALADNDRAMAATLYGLVTLQIGLSASSFALLHEVQARASLWDRLPRKAQAPVSGLSIDLALDELRRLMRFKPRLQLLSGSFLPPPLSIGRQPTRAPDPERLALARRVSTAMRSIPQAAADGGLSELLLPFADEVQALPPLAVEEYADACVEELALMLALEGMRRFLIANDDLLRARPAGFFDAGAALESGALGPFFTNVGMLLRGTSDIFALIDAAAGGRAEAASTECWSVLLAAHLPEDRLVSLSAELGDRGMPRALGHLLARIARRSADARPFRVAHSIRDACLDIDAFSVAGDAQHLVAYWHRADPAQWRRLGEIRGYAGDLAAAKAAFEQALRLDPSDAEARAQLTLVEAGEGIPFAEIHMARRNLRRARLAAFQAGGDRPGGATFRSGK